MQPIDTVDKLDNNRHSHKVTRAGGTTRVPRVRFSRLTAIAVIVAMLITGLVGYGQQVRTIPNGRGDAHALQLQKAKQAAKEKAKAKARAAAANKFRPLKIEKGDTFSYNADSLGNRIVDFSYCGYAASNTPIPASVPVKVLVPFKAGDATRRIQSALDYVGNLPLDKNGFRGTVQLAPGRYEVEGSLYIRTSGIVLKGSGSGDDENATTLIGAGTDRATLIEVIGKKDSINNPAIKITDDYVPVNATSFRVGTTDGLKQGDDIVITRPCTDEWIDKLGTRSFGGDLSALGWKSGAENIFWSRKITGIKGQEIKIDAPLTTALDQHYGGGTVARFQWPGRVNHIGIENLNLVSACDSTRPKDEDHRWMAITVDNAVDGWIRRVVFRHFAGSSVNLLSGTQRFTIEDCQSLDPVSEIGGQRRYTFQTAGQQNLFQRLYSESGYHDFAVGFCAAGPNAFVQCQAEGALSYSGSINSWASGVLFDVVRLDGQTLQFANLGQDEQGAGWNAANSLFWNCYAARVNCYKPPTAQNYAIGTWSQFGGDGYWEESNNWMRPRSFYYTQLAQRLGHQVDQQARLMPSEGEASSSPTVAAAAELTAEAYQPAMTMQNWIDSIIHNHPLPMNGSAAKIKTIDEIGLTPEMPVQKAPAMEIRNGWLVRGRKVVTGYRQQVPWWSGTVQQDFIRKAKPAITRFVPGRTGTGLTDNLDSVTSYMKDHHVTTMEQNYGLWYDRRRDDHERVRRQDGNVWPPFYELPFARSGQGTAWDGLSKYDLTRYNLWYWHRLKQFADLADEKGLVLIHHNYFQHNIIEAGAHYADFPWRPVNNINHTGFPEPVHYAADKRLFMAEQFYDENSPVRRKLHQAFIEQCLNNFKGNSSVIQFICEEYSGPLHFVKFWLDTILEWERKNGKTGQQSPLIGLSTTKDVQDSILEDKVRSAAVRLIDVRYWYYQQDGSSYAPKGGQSLAPRQQARLFKPQNTNFEQIYRAVREYRDKYPDKAVMYSAKNYDALPWASFMAGGSLAPLPPGLSTDFLDFATGCLPVDLPGANRQPKESITTSPFVYGLKQKSGMIFYLKAGNAYSIPLSAVLGNHHLARLVIINPNSGRVLSETKLSGTGVDLPESDKDLVYWLLKEQ
ncbi:MAG TPA: DUF6298 domain-containing protein [Arachidicoccus sp.]|nr:DUF6298 domain-containing protein [Arachidicoccus sp.]